MSDDGKKLVYPPQKYNAQTLPPQFDGNAMPLTPGARDSAEHVPARRLSREHQDHR